MTAGRLTAPTRLGDIALIARKLAAANDPKAVRTVELELETAENLLRKSGYAQSVDELRPVNELRMRAIWKLGQMLTAVGRDAGGRPSKKLVPDRDTFRGYLSELTLDKNRALEVQRIGALPEDELERAFALAHQNGVLCTIVGLVTAARPYWYKEARKTKHARIVIDAQARERPELIGPFPLIYADPPWSFETYSELGKEMSADRHYPTLPIEAIEAFEIQGRAVREVAHKDAALFLWCTSSNVHLALQVMTAWDFQFAASAVWLKDRPGTGYVFRNRHELVLYGKRGNMPAPQYVPESAFIYPRGEHSAKPPQIRETIERMYPDFDELTRLELFARGEIRGWSTYGLEAGLDRRRPGAAS